MILKWNELYRSNRDLKHDPNQLDTSAFRTFSNVTDQLDGEQKASVTQSKKTDEKIATLDTQEVDFEIKAISLFSSTVKVDQGLVTAAWFDSNQAHFRLF